MKKQKLVVIGNGMAGVNAIEEILKINANAFDVVVFGTEPYPNYNRIQLSKVLQGDTALSDITLNDWHWYEDNHIRLYPGETVTKIDKEKQIVYTDKAKEEDYDQLIIATGSNPVMLPLPGAEKQGVTAFRDIKDCENMVTSAKHYQKAAVIGGGLLGLEAARGLLNLGMEVDVVHLGDALMDRQLDETAGYMLKHELEGQGMNFFLGKNTSEILGSKRVTGLRFDDGDEIKADLVVMAVGVKPNIGLAKATGISINKGILVDDYMQTEIPNIYAVGECVEHRGAVYGLVAPLYEQGRALAKQICGVADDGYKGSVVSTQLKVSGVDVFSSGQITADADTKAIQTVDDWNGIYKKVHVKEGKIAGAVLYGDTRDGKRLLSLMKKGAQIEDYMEAAQNDDAEANLTAEMPDDELICGCNGVSKRTIVEAIQTDGLTSVEQVRGCTNASRSCGTCRGLVSDLLEYTLGDDYVENQQEAICGCTTLTKDEVIAEITDKGMKTTREVMHVLGWNNEEGCSKCKPALNYYMGMLYPMEYEDEKESRYVNERLHANIQKDGTFSVVPRMYGGVTDSDTLRKIADASDKYDAGMIKLTGGQRIDLLGVKKEDLPDIWSDLDMPSGHAYAKGLRTVKTCVGEDFCRFGTQDSVGMGVRLEKKFEGLNSPHKIKMSVSACPRNCAEGGVKDVGVIGLDGVWEIYVGGNGGTELRQSELLIKVQTSNEVIEYVGAFLQYYRETAHYLERTSKWVDRMGIEHVRETVENKQMRDSLNERMDIALAAVQEPWSKAINNGTLLKELYETVHAEVSN